MRFRERRGLVFPLSLVSVLLFVGGLWWGLAVVAWVAWEKRFASPGQRKANAEGPKEKQKWVSKFVDVVEFGLPFVLSIGLALDGISGGRVLSAPGWSLPIPFAEVFQVFGAVVLFAGLPIFTAGAYLTGKYVYSKLPEERTLLQRGPYRLIRHPIYLSFVLTGAGFILLAQNAVTLPLLYVFTAFTYPEEEEAELIRIYGDTYREYQRRTGRFLPKLRPG